MDGLIVGAHRIGSEREQPRQEQHQGHAQNECFGAHASTIDETWVFRNHWIECFILVVPFVA